MTTPRGKKLALKITKGNLARVVQQYVETKSLADLTAARLKSQRDALIDYVEEQGIEDDKGHRHVEVPGFGILKRERRVSSVFDAEYAEEWLKEHKMWDACTETITVIDEDTVMARIYDGSIPEDVGDAMYGDKESFAFKVQEGK